MVLLKQPLSDRMATNSRRASRFVVTAASRPSENVIEFERSRSYRLTCVGLFLWWIASLYPLIPAHELEEQLRSAADTTAQATSEGSVINRVIVVSFAILGGLYLPRALRVLRTRKEVLSLLYLLGAYLLWSAATIFWTDDVTLSIRRLGILILSLIGVLGLGAGFYSQTRQRSLTVARHVLYASWIAIIVLLISRLRNLHFSELLNPEWTLKDTPTQFYMYPLAYGIISALVLYPSAKMKQVASLSLLSIVLLFLKGRTMMAGTLAAALLTSSRLGKRSFGKAIGFFVGIVFLLVQIDLATGGWAFRFCVSFLDDSSSSLLAYLTRGGGTNDLLFLDGRVPLWQALWPYFCEHPFIGHGFGAFWNPNRFYGISVEATWAAPGAHNGLLDELLGTGVIGLLLALVFWFASMRLNLRVARQDKRAGYLVFGWLLLFFFLYSTGAIGLTSFESPTLFSLTALFALSTGCVNYSLRPLTDKMRRPPSRTGSMSRTTACRSDGPVARISGPTRSSWS
jgi:O-antigen ligase